ncbi:acetylxylan esterase [Schumannella luteola]
MPFFDLPLDQLTRYRPATQEPEDFDEFWARTLGESRDAGEGIRLTPVVSRLSFLEVFDVRFPGFGGEPVSAWLLLPRHVAGRLPTVVEYLGYGSGRGVAQERLAWAAAGYAHLVMDTRGQGSVWGAGGDTPDPHGAGPSAPGFVTKGIDSPESYYYRRVIADAVRAVDAVLGLDRVDPDRVVAAGASQGGGIALAVAGLVPGLAAVLPDVPFLSHFDRAVGLTDTGPYSELVRYLAVHRSAEAVVRRTLSYVDAVHHARRASAPALFSVGLMDTVCPPSTVFAAFNHYAGAPSEIEVYPYNQHEGGAPAHWERQADWLAGVLG